MTQHRLFSAPGNFAPQPTIQRSGSGLRAYILDNFEKNGIGWVWATDEEGRLSYLSDAAAKSLGKSVNELIGLSIEQVFETDYSDPSAHHDRSLSFQLTSKKKIRDHIARVAVSRPTQNSRRTWWSLNAHPIIGPSGNFEGYCGSASDITRDYERKLADSKLADFDSLTGLANRHNIDRQMESRINALRGSERTTTLIMIDLDKFKRVNDTLGHQAGDTLLKKVAERLQSIVGGRGTVARLGGDEFQVVIPDHDDRGELGELVTKIIDILSQPYQLEDGKHAIIGASAGIAIAPYDGDTREDLVGCADLALYAAKNGGRKQFRFYSSDLKTEEDTRQSLIDDLQTALEHGQLSMYYQPVVDISNGNIVCLEALLRWEHPEKGFISPSHFIPVIEESDLIIRLGEWAMRTACSAAVKWPGDLPVAVNVSSVQFSNHAFPAMVMNILAHTGLAPSRLELEFTESVFIGDTDEAERTFQKLKEIGVRLSLDDFGTGYSSLSYLRSAPFDKIKVDKSFVDSCTQKDKNSANVIAAIVGIANALNMETTVEGVEAFDQLEVVRDKGATQVQGFIYSLPLPEDQVAGLLTNSNFTIAPKGPDTYRPDRRAVFRRVGVIHQDYYYNAVMRDVSRNGACIDGIEGIPVGTPVVVDLGDGQVVVSKVCRVSGSEFAVDFEETLVDDGAGGLCTRHRISRLLITEAGLPKKAGAATEAEGKRSISTPMFKEVAARGHR